MTRRLRVAIVGAGVGASHLDGYLALPDLFDVVSIADLSQERAAPLVASASCDYDQSLDAVLARSDIDLVNICLPPNLHKQAILDALAANKHVICEKPLVGSLADCDEIIAATQSSDYQVIPVFQYRFGQGLGQLCHLIEAGLAGKALVATIETHWNRTPDYYSVPWRGQWDTELGGAMVGHAIHAHDLLVRVLGPIATVQVQLATRVNDIAVEDCAACIIGMQCGALVTSSVTLGSARDQSRLRFCFDFLSAESSLNPYNPGTAPWEFVAREPARQSLIDEALEDYPEHNEGFARQFELAHAAIVDAAEPPVTLSDARASLELITAAYSAHENGTRVSLPLQADHPAYAGWVPERKRLRV